MTTEKAATLRALGVDCEPKRLHGDPVNRKEWRGRHPDTSALVRIWWHKDLYNGSESWRVCARSTLKRLRKRGDPLRYTLRFAAEYEGRGSTFDEAEASAHEARIMLFSRDSL